MQPDAGIIPLSIARRLDQLEKKYDAQFKVLSDAIRQLMFLPEAKQRKVDAGRQGDGNK